MSLSFIHAVLFLLLFTSCSTFEEPPPLPEFYTYPYYDLNVDIYPEENLIQTQMRLTFGKELIEDGKLIMMVRRNAEIHSLEGPGISDFESLAKGSRKQIIINLSDTTKDRYELLAHYSVEIPADHQVNRVTEDWIELNIDSFWLPLVASFPRIEYDLDLTIVGNFQVLTGDLITQNTDDVTHIKSRIPRVDIPFSAAPDFIQKAGEFVSVYSPSHNTKMDSVLTLADNALHFLSTYLDEPEDFDHERKVVLSPRKEVGYSRKNYVVLSDISEMPAIKLSGFLSHEFSHYWFSEANITTKNHWLSESFAEYLSLIYLREKYGYQAFQNKLKKMRERIADDEKPLADYEKRPSYLALYFKGPIILHEFEEYLGRESYQQLMNHFVDNRIATNDKLFEAIHTLFGPGAVDKLEELRATI